MVLSVAVASLLTACAGPFDEWPGSKAGIAAAEPIITELRAYKHMHGAYPGSLGSLDLPKAVLAQAENKGLRYHAHKDGAAYTIGFNPAGPVHLCAYGEGFPQSAPRWQCGVK